MIAPVYLTTLNVPKLNTNVRSLKLQSQACLVCSEVKFSMKESTSFFATCNTNAGEVEEDTSVMCARDIV